MPIFQDNSPMEEGKKLMVWVIIAYGKLYYSYKTEIQSCANTHIWCLGYPLCNPNPPPPDSSLQSIHLKPLFSYSSLQNLYSLTPVAFALSTFSIKLLCLVHLVPRTNKNQFQNTEERERDRDRERVRERDVTSGGDDE
ncbi:hypothetical protein YC2023_115134 [Brassica napus]